MHMRIMTRGSGTGELFRQSAFRFALVAALIGSLPFAASAQVTRPVGTGAQHGRAAADAGDYADSGLWRERLSAGQSCHHRPRSSVDEGGPV